MNKISKLNGYRTTPISTLNLDNSNEDSDEIISGTLQHKSLITNFDLVPKLIESSSLIENQSFAPKIIKMFDSIQQSFDIQNECLAENFPKLNETILIDLAKKSSDLTHRQQLQSMLIIALNENDLNKASLIHSFLNPISSTNSNINTPLSNFADLFGQVANSQNINKTNASKSLDQSQTEDEIDANNFIALSSNNTQNTLTENEQLNESNKENNDDVNGNEISAEVDNDLPNHNSDFNDNNNSNGDMDINDTSQNESISTDDNTIFIDKKVRPKLRAGPLSPIRHLICSPGLEATAHKYKITVLYRGVCNGSCYANKPWSKQVHLHYIVNTVNCNDHISRLVKKQGIQFYNSFVLQNPERWNQLIQMYRMEKVKTPQLNQTM